MKNHYLKGLFVGVISVLLISCAGRQVQTTAPAFTPHTFQANKYVSKVDNFVVILDTSSSMSEKYGGQPKADIAKNFLMAMNRTLPELKYNGALRTFGHSAHLPDRSTMSVYGIKSYSTAEFGSALKGVKGPGGDSSLPLAKAITAAGGDLKSTQGPIAVIIVSDGADMNQEPVKAAKTLKGKFGDRLCIDTVQVGNDSDGKTVLEQIAGASGCGFSTTADRLATSSSLAGFVEGVFLAKPSPVAVVDSDGDGVPDNKDKCPNTPGGVKVDVFGCPLDSDGDGVANYLDQCPDTPMGATVDARGCWTYAAVVLFDINSAEVKSEAYPMLNEAVLIMKKNPDLNVEIDGHTDSTGAVAYNMTLSEKRASAIKDHLVTRGIDPKRLTTKGFGFTKPAAGNDTKEGRAKNRRVEFTPVR
ncbi:MAG: OmpA family protein [Deltaproteobacteria bacterium]|nr:OmpA family protein [Deltaproteobacteria bacterium]